MNRNAFVRLKQNVSDFLKGEKDKRFTMLSGLRGSGKTTLFTQVFDTLKDVPRRNKMFISLDRLRVLGISLSDLLEVYEREILNTPLEKIQDPVFLFLDEVQYDREWMLTLKTVYDRTKNVCIFATGSAALMLRSGRVGADIARRVRYERLFPMSFTEYMKIKHGVPEEKELSETIRKIFLESTNAGDVFSRLTSLKTGRYLAQVHPDEKDRYLRYGSLPFILSEKNEVDTYTQIYQMMEKVVRNDMLTINEFEHSTVNRTLEMLHLIAHSDKVPVSGLSRSLGLSRSVVTDILKALEQSEALLRIPPYGSVSSQIRKSSKYTFIASSVRTALFRVLGTNLNETTYMGRLLEDVVALYLHRVFVYSHHRHLYYDVAKGGADFIVSRNDRDIVFEAGLGQKDAKQVYRTLKKTKPGSFGVIISSDTLNLDNEGSVVTVPLELFLLM